MTEESKKKAIVRYKEKQGLFDFGTVNDKIECYMVKQGAEEEDVKKRFM